MLTKIADEGAVAAQELAVQLSLILRAHMGCWGVDHGDTDDDETSRDSGNTSSNLGAGSDTASAVTKDEKAVSKREHTQCMSWWEKVLGRWHDRTQLVDPSLQRKFKVVNQGPWAQVTASLGDRERANRRAFMTESEVRKFLPVRFSSLKLTVLGVLCVQGRILVHCSYRCLMLFVLYPVLPGSRLKG